MTLNGIIQLLLDGCRVTGYLFFDFFLCSILLLHITAYTRTTPARQECRDLLRSQFSNGIVRIASESLWIIASHTRGYQEAIIASRAASLTAHIPDKRL